MKKIILYIKEKAKLPISLLIICLITSILNLIINKNITNILLLIFQIIIFFNYGCQKGKITNRKAIIEGIYNALKIIIILLIIAIILFKVTFNISNIIFYTIIFISIIFGTIYGKNKTMKNSLS